MLIVVKQPSERLSRLAAALIFLTSMTAPLAHAEYVLQKALYEFFPTNSQPYDPATRLVQGQDGNFYGTTRHGGTNTFGDSAGKGTIFRITPDGNVKVLFSFNHTNGEFPSFGGLVQDSDGLLYGTTTRGSTNSIFGDGTFFKATTNGALTTLFYFQGTNGTTPTGLLARGSDGFYGATFEGGNYGLGTLFKITPNGIFTLLHSFDGTNDGGYPPSGLTLASDGSFYGMTLYGGNGFTGFSGYGTLFRFTTNGIFTPLVYFDTNNIGSPKGRLANGSDGNLYGVAGKQIFKMTTNGALTVLATFNGTNGSRCFGGVTEGMDGDFYGVTSSRLDDTNLIYYGTIFKVTTNGELKTIFKFDGTKARNPFGTFTRATDGNLYVAVADEQANLTLDGNAGAVFRLVETPSLTVSRSIGSVTVTWTSFTNGVYRVESRPSLSATSWTTLVSNLMATGATASFTDLSAVAAERYYRVVLLP